MYVGGYLQGSENGRVVNEHSTFFVNFTMSEGISEASAAKKRKLGQRFRPEYCIEFSCLMKSTREHYAYCKY